MTPAYVLIPPDGEDVVLEQPFADIGVWWFVAFVLCVSSLIIVAVVGVVRWRQLPRIHAEIADLEVQCRQQENDIREASRTLKRFSELIENVGRRRGR